VIREDANLTDFRKNQKKKEAKRSITTRRPDGVLEKKGQSTALV